MKRTLLAVALSVLACTAPAAPSRADDTIAAAPFWEHWGDGRAELAGYALRFPRYGAVREGGVAVTIFVTETFSESARVKADPGRHPESDTFPVMKLNLVQDFQTGIYDYNLMTSAFAALAPVAGRPAGAPTKVSFSSQEWCGHVYHQLLFDRGGVREVAHSYFDGEADREGKLPWPEGGVSEDLLWHWARGLAAPLLGPDEQRAVPFLPSLEHARLKHQPLAWTRATLRREVGAREVSVPAGTFAVERRSVEIEGGRRWVFDVEKAWPHRIVRWESSEGHVAELLASTREKYWELNGPGGETALEKLGLRPRPPRTP